ncbi:MAG TPA: hypothetical protein VEO53_18405, partial [Candidatus Binatia bacterium]|nr:hypothetical protein [Candidatus Binatia bacterium]
LLGQINALVAQAGRAVFKKKENGEAEPIRAKADSYVLETNVHFPTDAVAFRALSVNFFQMISG